MISVVYAKDTYAEWHVKALYAECGYAECRGAIYRACRGAKGVTLNLVGQVFNFKLG